MLVTICAYVIVMILMYYVTARVCHVIIELKGEGERVRQPRVNAYWSSQYPPPSK